MKRLPPLPLLTLLACAHAQPVATTAPKPPTVEEAQGFYDGVDKDLRRLWVARDRAGWVNENFITDDTEALAAQGEAATAEYMGKAIPASRRFASLQLSPELTRMAYLLSISQVVPAPLDAGERDELAALETQMTSAYGKAKYCPKSSSTCQTLDDLSKTLAKVRKYDDLQEAWLGWHNTAKEQRQRFSRYVELGNEGARAIGFADLGALWRSGYDMTPEAFEAQEEHLWEQVKPLYASLHCYVRRKLREHYGEAHVPKGGPIPVELTGNMWGQEWKNIYDLVAPYPKEPSLDVEAGLKKKKTTPKEMVKIGENFFTSLGFPPLPQSFWDRSLFTRPKDRDVVCHASAWDVQWDGDLRIKMCIQPNEEDLITIHHELGHDFYFQSYYTLPILFQQGANDGFHEGIGDTIALSVTPAYLHSIGLLDKVADNPKAKINHQMKMALGKVAFLPFGLLIDKWRWDVFSGKITPANYNTTWWELRKQYQGEAPPVPRGEDQFDPAAKFHIASSTPYARYFMATVYQFQFHRALCQAAGFKGPLDECSIYGNKDAGRKLRAMLQLGASKPWPDALEVISGQREADATAILDYFAPLMKWLDEENKGEKCGW
jgi:peptidyl-dipeptidase A